MSFRREGELRRVVPENLPPWYFTGGWYNGICTGEILPGRNFRSWNFIVGVKFRGVGNRGSTACVDRIGNDSDFRNFPSACRRNVIISTINVVHTFDYRTPGHTGAWEARIITITILLLLLSLRHYSDIVIVNASEERGQLLVK